MIKSHLKTIAYLLLLFNGFCAIYGGWRLTTNPDGSSLGLSLSLLALTPFHDFYIPGVVLLISNGASSLVASIGFTLKPRQLSWMVWVQGIILLGFLLVQIILIRTFHPLQLIMGIVGVALIWLGLKVAVKNKR